MYLVFLSDVEEGGHNGRQIRGITTEVDCDMATF